MKSELISMISNIQIRMVTKLNIKTTIVKTSDLRLDSSAIVHVYNNKAWFKTYKGLKKLEKVLIANHNYANVLGK